MGRYVTRRLLQALPLLLAITAISFAIIKVSPGGPLAAYEGMSLGTITDVVGAPAE